MAQRSRHPHPLDAHFPKPPIDLSACARPTDCSGEVPAAATHLRQGETWRVRVQVTSEEISMASTGVTPGTTGFAGTRMVSQSLDAFRSGWDGSARLWKIFWVYGAVVGTAIGIGVDLASRVLSTSQLFVIAVPVLSWALWLTVSLWRCAFNSSWRGWGHGVRAAIVLGVAAVVVALVGVFPDDDLV